ncbi:unnamed protein product [Rotaria sp. Silwood1]|nr:unnamed protein product [Rotaria sp. Silwood1]CAF3361383.1 unnamed protein product [Rotaria sp. Silwood1]CAF4697882.1 unnamed protein product [Rotaria sp. Silwood1]
MLSNRRHRQHQSLLQTPKIPNVLKKSTSGTLSPDTTTTTSSGYSTGGSSVSNTKDPCLKKSSSIAHKQHSDQEQHKTKSKGLHNLLSKLKSLLQPSRTKHIHTKTMRSTTSRQISSTNILRQYHQHTTIYDVLPSSLTTSNTISLPFTYYNNSPMRQSRGNFEKISAWLNQTEKITKNGQHRNDISFINSSKQKTTSSSSVKNDDQGIRGKKGKKKTKQNVGGSGSTSKVNIHIQGVSVYVLAITVVMKNTRANIRPPKRSSSLVTRITRPIIEQQSQRTISPASSFSSSILTKGMSERITPLQSSKQQKSDNHSSKSHHHHRNIDFSRRRTIASTNEQISNKENLSIKHQEKSQKDVYRFSPLLSKNEVEFRRPSSKHIVTKQYYFHSYPTETNEDLLNNSYGLTLLKQQKQQQQQQQPAKQRHSVGTVLMISQAPNHVSSQKQLNPSTLLQQEYTLDSLDDLLCDREVESYFYPTSQSDHIYMNLENISDPYQAPLSYIHETLC